MEKVIVHHMALHGMQHRNNKASLVDIILYIQANFEYNFGHIPDTQVIKEMIEEMEHLQMIQYVLDDDVYVIDERFDAKSYFDCEDF